MEASARLPELRPRQMANGEESPQFPLHIHYTHMLQRLPYVGPLQLLCGYPGVRFPLRPPRPAVQPSLLPLSILHHRFGLSAQVVGREPTASYGAYGDLAHRNPPMHPPDDIKI
eukprot:578894-Amorphochlora_amoeboformis.AAC.2